MIKIHSPFASQARALVTDNATFTPALHTLFLQRWRLSLVVQATTLNQQLLDENEQLLSEVQERMTLSGQLEEVLVENENAAGRLWDMSAGQLKRGDYQLIVKYGDFLTQQPELMKLAEQLGPSREAKSVQRKTRRWKPSARWSANQPPCPSKWMDCGESDDILRLLPTELSTLGMTELEYEFYRRLVEKQLLTLSTAWGIWRHEKVSQRPVVHQDFDEQPRDLYCLRGYVRIRWVGLTVREGVLPGNRASRSPIRRRCFIMLFSQQRWWA